MSRASNRGTGFRSARRPTFRALASAAATLLTFAPARAQTDDTLPPAESTIEQYLTDHGLTELLAVHLLERLKTADGDARVKLADRLGSIYVRLLDKASTPEARRQWEARSQDLLKAVPEADSSELRLNLAKARYLQAE